MAENNKPFLKNFSLSNFLALEYSNLISDDGTGRKMRVVFDLYALHPPNEGRYSLYLWKVEPSLEDIY